MCFFKNFWLFLVLFCSLSFFISCGMRYTSAKYFSEYFISIGWLLNKFSYYSVYIDLSTIPSAFLLSFYTIITHGTMVLHCEELLIAGMMRSVPSHFEHLERLSVCRAKHAGKFIRPISFFISFSSECLLIFITAILSIIILFILFSRFISCEHIREVERR